MAQFTASSTDPRASQPADVTLACRPDRAGNLLIFPYSVTNNGAADIYVMDAVPAVDQAHQPSVDRNAAVIWLGADGYAHILKGIGLLPALRSVLGRVIPLAARLPPGETLQRRLEVPLPLAETGPYNSELPLRQYEPLDIQGVTLTIEFLRGTAEGFGAETVDYAPDLYRVWSRHTVGQTERVSCAFPSRQLQILKRSDDFPRPD